MLGDLALGPKRLGFLPNRREPTRRVEPLDGRLGQPADVGAQLLNPLDRGQVLGLTSERFGVARLRVEPGIDGRIELPIIPGRDRQLLPKLGQMPLVPPQLRLEQAIAAPLGVPIGPTDRLGDAEVGNEVGKSPTLVVPTIPPHTIGGLGFPLGYHPGFRVNRYPSAVAKARSVRRSSPDRIGQTDPRSHRRGGREPARPRATAGRRGRHGAALPPRP